MNEKIMERPVAVPPELSRGFRFLHKQINETTKKTLQSTSFLYALIDILTDKGIITIEELDERKKEIAANLVTQHAKSGIGCLYQDPEMDKYSFEGEADVDCGDKMRHCRAICCKIPFALSRQDVEEGIVRWDFGRPYVIAHGDDGYCVHLDRETYRCTVHEHRPVPCRGFNCRDSKRWNIWEDAECTSLEPELQKRIDDAVEICYTGRRNPEHKENETG